MDRQYPDFFHADQSNNALSVTTPPLFNKTIWDLPYIDHAFVVTPEFYQRIIGLEPPIDREVGIKIATVVELETIIT